MRRRVSVLEKLSSSDKFSYSEPLAVFVYGSDESGVEILLDAWSASGEHIYHLEQSIGEKQTEIKDDSNR